MSGAQYDDPNRESLGLAPAWTEGDGGEVGELPPPPEGSTDPQTAPASDDPLDDMTKDELLEVATTRGIDVRDYWSKGEIREAIDNA